jgi:hypothetical protein
LLQSINSTPAPAPPSPKHTQRSAAGRIEPNRAASRSHGTWTATGKQNRG